MHVDNTNERVQQIRRRLIHAQVMFERAERTCGGVAEFLCAQGVPPEIWEKVKAQDLHTIELSYQHTRDLLLFEIAMLTGTPEDFQTFVDAFLGNGKPTAPSTPSS